MPPGEKALRRFLAEEFPANKHRQYPAGEVLGQPQVVDPGELMEEARHVHSALGHQEMQMRVKFDPVA